MLVECECVFVLGLLCRENVCYFDVVYRYGVEKEIVEPCVIMPSSSYSHLEFL